MSRLIKLTKNYNAIVDNGLYKRLSKHRWMVTLGKMNVPYACRYEIDEATGVRKVVLMHREIIDAPKNANVSHINLQSLDNRRSNLRVCTASQFRANRRHYKCSKTRVKGVYAYPRAHGTAYVAKVTCNNIQHHIGVYPTLEEAALEYNRAAHWFFGEFSRPNVV